MKKPTYSELETRIKHIEEYLTNVALEQRIVALENRADPYLPGLVGLTNPSKAQELSQQYLLQSGRLQPCSQHFFLRVQVDKKDDYTSVEKQEISNACN